jgi:hypothetical protein
MRFTSTFGTTFHALFIVFGITPSGFRDTTVFLACFCFLRCDVFGTTHYALFTVFGPTC